MMRLPDKPGRIPAGAHADAGDADRRGRYEIENGRVDLGSAEIVATRDPFGCRELVLGYAVIRTCPRQVDYPKEVDHAKHHLSHRVLRAPAKRIFGPFSIRPRGALSWVSNREDRTPL